MKTPYEQDTAKILPKLQVDVPDLGPLKSVESVQMWRASDGSLHGSEESARYHNARRTLHAQLVRDIDSKLNVMEIRELIVAKLADWYTLWLEAKNKT